MHLEGRRMPHTESAAEPRDAPRLIGPRLRSLITCLAFVGLVAEEEQRPAVALSAELIILEPLESQRVAAPIRASVAAVVDLIVVAAVAQVDVARRRRVM